MTTTPLAVTMGDPAGIGVEIILKSWLERHQQKLAPFMVLGDAHWFQHQADQYEMDVKIQQIDMAKQTLDIFNDKLPVLHIPCAVPVIAGHGNPDNTRTVMTCIKTAVKLTQTNHTSGIVTAPLHKNTAAKGGFDFPGHTEFLAHLAGPVSHSVMMLTAPELTPPLRVVPVTSHIPLKNVAEKLKYETIIHYGEVTADHLRHLFGIPQPRLAIAALNPHAGDQGLMGDEEIRIIAPAVKGLQERGIDCHGPFPADTLFHHAARKNYDAVLCMYHDQALLPLKTLDFDHGVNITLGLPFIRTSPDHGTAFDIAGKNIANPASMISALQMAQRLISKQQVPHGSH